MIVDGKVVSSRSLAASAVDVNVFGVLFGGALARFPELGFGGFLHSTSGHSHVKLAVSDSSETPRSLHAMVLCLNGNGVEALP